MPEAGDVAVRRHESFQRALLGVAVPLGMLCAGRSYRLWWPGRAGGAGMLVERTPAGRALAVVRPVP